MKWNKGMRTQIEEETAMGVTAHRLGVAGRAQQSQFAKRHLTVNGRAIYRAIPDDATAEVVEREVEKAVRRGY